MTRDSNTRVRSKERAERSNLVRMMSSSKPDRKAKGQRVKSKSQNQGRDRQKKHFRRPKRDQGRKVDGMGRMIWYVGMNVMRYSMPNDMLRRVIFMALSNTEGFDRLREELLS